MLHILTEIANITSEVTLQNSQISNILSYFGDRSTKNKDSKSINLSILPCSPIIKNKHK